MPDNCYFTLGSKILRQTIGVPIGVDPAPFIANLTLWFYENKYLEKLYKREYYTYSARMMGKTFRLIDDITTVNSDDVFSRHVGDIYPASLTLNKENEVNDKANVLDLKFMINRMIFRFRLSNFREKIVIYPATLYARYLCSRDALGLKAKRGARR